MRVAVVNDCALKTAVEPSNFRLQADKLDPVMKVCNREVLRCYGPLSQRANIGPETGVIVCTFEKANTLINRLIEQQQLGGISCVVVDELHMVRSVAIARARIGHLRTPIRDQQAISCFTWRPHDRVPTHQRRAQLHRRHHSNVEVQPQKEMHGLAAVKPVGR